MVSSLTLSASVSTQSEAAWEVHTISRRAAPLLIRLKEGEAVVTMVTSLHLQLYILTYGLINRLLPSFALFFLLVVEGGGKWGELSVQACFYSISRNLHFKLLISKYDPCVLYSMKCSLSFRGDQVSVYKIHSIYLFILTCYANKV